MLNLELRAFLPEDIFQLRDLINFHLTALIPNWALPAETILRYLQSNPEQPLIDPWVRERKTLCVFLNQELIGAAHLLFYGNDETVWESYQGAGDIAFLLFYPDEVEAGQALLKAALAEMQSRKVQRIFAYDSGLPIPICTGISDTWQHITDCFYEAGFRHNPTRQEAAFGGTLAQIPAPVSPPIAGLSLKRHLQTRQGLRFSAILEGQEIAYCECFSDLTKGGDKPALRGWAELSEMFVQEAWRRRGVGTWLVQHMVAWLRLGGAERIVFTVAIDDELAGAGAYYQSLGWDAFSRSQDGWHLEI